MRYQEAINSLRSGKDKKFILTGSEPFLKEQFIRACRALQETSVYYPDDWKEALSDLSTEGLFGEKRAVVLFSFDKMKPELFVGHVKLSTDTIILTLTEKADLKSRTMTELMAVAQQVPCEKMKENGDEYPRWVESAIAGNGYTMENGVGRSMYMRVGADMHALSNEIEKLFMVSGESKNITLEQVRLYVSNTARATAFELLEDLLKGDVKGALGKMSSHTSSESLGDLLHLMCSYMEKFYRMLLLREQKFQTDEIADIIGIHKYYVRNLYMPKVVSLGKSAIADKIDRLVTLEARLRTFRGDKRILLEQFIYSFSQ